MAEYESRRHKVNKAGYARTYLYSESNRLREERQRGRTWDQIVEQMPFTSSEEIDGWIKSYRAEAAADPQWFSDHPVDVDLFFDLQDAIEKVEAKEKEEWEK